MPTTYLITDSFSVNFESKQPSMIRNTFLTETLKILILQA
nr:unnamed protein product [Callosobruchus chinensis]